jgi:CMP-N-acetylneuraminic acid synthetase
MTNASESEREPFFEATGGESRGALAVIPARAGSKRLPGKNVRVLCGLPALAYTIAAARDSGLFSLVMVSTDSEAIAEVARRYGAEVPFLRAAALSDDVTPVSSVTVDALTRVDKAGRRFAFVAQLMPNCPLRDAADVRDSFEQFRHTESYSQLSVARFGWQTPWWAMRRGDDFTLDPLFPREAVTRGQDLPPVFCPTGAIWWARAETLREAGTFHVPGRTGWEIDPVHAIDIDTEDDWRLAEALMVMQAEVTQAEVTQAEHHPRVRDGASAGERHHHAR